MLRSEWNVLGRVDSLAPLARASEVPLAAAAVELAAQGCPTQLIFSNGFNWTFTLQTPPEGPCVETFRQSQRNLPFVLHDSPRTLAIGSGGGVEVFVARLNGATDIVAVDVNPLMFDAATSWTSNSWNGAWNGVQQEVVDGRTYVETTPRKFDVITLGAVDTSGGESATLSTNYLYTREAFGAYFGALGEAGVVFLVRPRAQLLRAVATASDVLREHGATDLSRHFVVLSDAELMAGAVFVDPLGDADVERLRGALGVHLQNAEHVPGVATNSPFSEVIAGRDWSALSEKLGVNVVPTTDDAPYFYQLSPRFVGSAAASSLFEILAIVLTLATLLLFAPLIGLPLLARRRTVVTSLVYFGGLGAGFMLVEISLIQKLSLVVGHPNYSVAVTLGTMLIFSGLGSLTSGRIAHRSSLPTLCCAVAALILGGYALLGDWLLGFAPSALGGRGLLAAAYLAPVSFFMGMPFPTKVRTIDDVNLVSWAWAVNGLASVAGSVLAVVLAMNLGFTAVILIGASCYVAAALAHRLDQ